MKVLLFILVFIISASAYSVEFKVINGMRIETSCLEKFSSSFPSDLKAGIDKGLACLKDLDGAGSKLNHDKLQDLLSSELTFACHEEEYFQKKAWSFAHASPSDSFNMPELELIHPFVSFNPNLKTLTSLTPELLGSISFHELFHNIGYLHNLNEEYAYACEECCFGNADYKEAACNLCKKTYDAPEDLEYLKDFTAYYDVSEFSSYFDPGWIVRKALKMYPTSPEYMGYLIYFDKWNNPLSIVSAREWNKMFPIPHSTNSGLSPMALNEPEINKLVDLAFEARNAFYIQGSLTKAVDAYLKFDVKALKQFMALDAKLALALKDAIIKDMNIMYRNMPQGFEYPELDNKYDEIKAVSEIKIIPKFFSPSRPLLRHE